MNLAKRYGHKSSSNFVNAILRKVTVKDYEEFFQLKDDIQRISITNSMPRWIIEELTKQLGDIKKVEEIAINSNLRPHLSIRINNLKTAKNKNIEQELIKKLEEKNIEVKQGLLEDF